MKSKRFRPLGEDWEAKKRTVNFRSPDLLDDPGKVDIITYWSKLK